MFLPSRPAVVPAKRRTLARLVAGLCAALGASAGSTAFAADPAAAYPQKVIRIVVPNPAGGASDVMARLIGKKLTERWGQAVVVENKAGANGSIGASYVAKSDADGYTLLLMDSGSLTISPSIMKLNYSPTEDLAPVSVVAYSPHILVVSNKLPVHNVQELIDYAKANKGRLNFGETPGSITHLAGVLFASQTGIDWNYIGYKGGSQVLSDLAGGQIDVAMNSFLATYPLVKGGTIRMLAVASTERFAPIPDTPALSERLPGFVTGSWQTLMAPAGTPPAIVEKLHATIAEIVNEADTKQRFAELGSEPVTMTPAEMGQWLRKETDHWARVVKEGDIKVF
ncbi:hypothetical protein CEK29_19410 [Bordetella genomosp. 5]|uniref:Bug family tripartite tricarboxylate transporter substrate binding protein n=1 Tax=Bordetella genomosp. 5 TaxID=1395608 RepID=UPI000B9E8356|nr:tripartite tricarboxylate transporter substrate binding protein [Bordetella genomosp. 5]OZI39715.1 hypothetical protein CEK29_19410 [Bordetella genomosp. 5]